MKVVVFNVYFFKAKQSVKYRKSRLNRMNDPLRASFDVLYPLNLDFIYFNKFPRVTISRPFDWSLLQKYRVIDICSFIG